MNNQKMGFEHTNTAASRENFMEELLHVVKDVEELLNVDDNQILEGNAAAHAHLHESLQAVKKRLAAAQDTLIGRAQEAARSTFQYYHY